MIWTSITVIFLIILFILWKMFVVIEERHEGIKERLGDFKKVLRPGFHFLIPFLDKVSYLREMREQVIDVPAQSCITSDNIQVEVDGVLYLKIMDAKKASYGIEDYRRGCVNLAQTTMRSEIGKISLDHTFSERESINENIVKELDKASDPWGVKVLRYEIKDINPPAQVVDTMEKQMEAERDKRAAIIDSSGKRDYKINISEGEKQRSINLSEGEKQKKINLAEGKAKEISLLADASASSIRQIADSIKQNAGDKAVNLQLIEQYVEEFGSILHSANLTVLPTDLANLKGLFEGIFKSKIHKTENYDSENGSMDEE
jgi:regulator of protease activity HflC (stomatin/prohibitin superfamily)